jgi:hypothetical protein
MTQDDSLPDKIATSFQHLRTAAAELNAASDQLAGPIAALDAALKPLNLGISAWVEFAGDFDHNTGDFWARDIGYAKVAAKWGIALQTREGNAAHDPEPSIERWPFNEAPRAFRVEAVEKLPELLDHLIKEANATVEKIRDKIGYAQQVVAAIGGPPPPPKLSPQALKSAREDAIKNLLPTPEHRALALREMENALGLSAAGQAVALREMENATGFSAAAQAEALRAMEQAAGLSKIEREEAIQAMERAAGLSKVERDAAIWAMRQAASLSQIERDAAVWAMERATGFSAAAQAEALRAMEQATGLSAVEREAALRAMERATGFSAAAQAEALRAMEQATNRSKVSRAKPPIRPVGTPYHPPARRK